MYKVTRCRNDAGDRLASVIEVRRIRRSCQLFPLVRPGSTIPREWTSSSVLDVCEHFWVNPFSDMHMYMTLY